MPDGAVGLVFKGSLKYQVAVPNDPFLTNHAYSNGLFYPAQSDVASSHHLKSHVLMFLEN